MGLIGILRNPKWWWKHRWYSWRSEIVGQHISITDVEEYNNGNKRYHWQSYWDYKDPKTEYEYAFRVIGGIEIIWGDDSESIEDKFDIEVRHEYED